MESFHVCKAIKHFLQLLFNEGETVAKMFGIMIQENLNMSLTLIAPEKKLLMKKKIYQTCQDHCESFVH